MNKVFQWPVAPYEYLDGRHCGTGTGTGTVQCKMLAVWLQRVQEVPRAGHAAAARRAGRGGRRAGGAAARRARTLRLRLSQIQGNYRPLLLFILCVKQKLSGQAVAYGMQHVGVPLTIP